MKKKPRVKIYTDASFDKDTKAYGWAVIIIDGQRRYMDSGSGYVETSCAAEYSALKHGLKAISKFNVNITGRTLVFYTDNIKAMNKFAMRRNVRYDKSLNVTHVRAHVGRTHNEKLNDECDSIARAEMARLRESKG